MELLRGVLLFFLITGALATVFLYIKDPRTLFLGIFATLSGASFLSLLILYGQEQDRLFSQTGVWGIVVAAVAFAVVGFLLAPLLLTVLFLVTGIKLLYREGLSFRNLLSLLLGLFILLFPMAGSYFNSIFFRYPLLVFLMRFSIVALVYLVLLVSAFVLSDYLNAVHIFRRKPDYIVVLGSGLSGDRVTPLLAARINLGIRICQKNPGSRLLMSGGRGKDELISEAEAMKRYAVEQGVPAQNILTECRSANTRENILFSNHMMEPGSSFAIVTSRYHLFRALITAKELGIPCIGYGAKTKLYFHINAYIREWIGYLYLKRKVHGTVLIIMAALLAAGTGLMAYVVK